MPLTSKCTKGSRKLHSRTRGNKRLRSCTTALNMGAGDWPFICGVNCVGMVAHNFARGNGQTKKTCVLGRPVVRPDPLYLLMGWNCKHRSASLQQTRPVTLNGHCVSECSKDLEIWLHLFWFILDKNRQGPRLRFYFLVFVLLGTGW